MEVQNEYSSYYLKSRTDIAELEDKLELQKNKGASSVQLEELTRQLSDARYKLIQNEEKIAKLEDDHRDKQDFLKGEIISMSSDLKAKDKYITQLCAENDEFKSNLERIGFETFLTLKKDLFAEE